MMPLRQILFALFLVAQVHGIAAATPPVNPEATPEAVQLLDYLYGIRGTGTLAGQHNKPFAGSDWLDAARHVTRKYPALFGQDFGFSPSHTEDGINYRQQTVKQVIKRHGQGYIVTLTWHAVRPTDDEPVGFTSSVQGKLTDEQWQELMTPGTPLRLRWEAQVDVIAAYLKQLQDAGIPILWRPYHEMNANWFWWGKRAGDNGFKHLWRMLYERLVTYHKLNNLIWVYSCNELMSGVDPFDDYFPGTDVVDVLAVDVYNTGFSPEQYQEISRLAAGKPIALGEVGAAPSVEILNSQPNWAWFMLWDDQIGRAHV